MTLTGFQRKTLVHIITNIKRGHEYRIAPHKRVLPALSAINKVVTQGFYFLRRTISRNSFQNEIIIRLVIEATEKRLFSKKLPDCVIVVVNDCVFPRDLVLEDKKPIVGKHLAVENERFKVQWYHLQRDYPNIFRQGLLEHPP